MSKHRHRQLVAHERSAEGSLKILSRIWKFDWSIELGRVQSVVSQIEIEVAMHLAGTGFRDDLDASEAGAAVLGCKWIGINADFFDLFLWWDPAAEKPIDDKLHTAGSGGSRAGELRQVIRQLIFVLRQALNVVLFQDQRGLVILRVQCDQVRVVLNFDFLSELCNRQRHR